MKQEFHCVFEQTVCHVGFYKIQLYWRMRRDEFYNVQKVRLNRNKFFTSHDIYTTALHRGFRCLTRLSTCLFGLGSTRLLKE